ncbi:hypothetical protein LGQ02_01825 [Bacillus shivajii]|uniref:hypothetical protein n=1 Tax=Bacillus shivajii TaxID=1983719 RepID=UPI001CFB1924|nr:hypothetical protein [Bacillus shivajii]UCZ53560.1 hypothetical protein LGQ02_01825 [Bacillus shivajii]
MHDVWMVGPVILPVVWLVTAISLIIGFLFLRYFSPYKEKSHQIIRDRTANGVIFIIIGFYFGSIPLNMTTFLRDPLAVLSYPSGQYELIMGLLIALIYFIIQHIKKQAFMRDTLTALFFVVLVADFIFAFSTGSSGSTVTTESIPFPEHPTALYTMLITGTAAMLLVKTMQIPLERRAEYTLLTFIGWSFGKWTITSFEVTSHFFSVYVTDDFYLFFMLATAVVLILKIAIKKKQVIGWKN